MYFVRKINTAVDFLDFPKSGRDFWWVENLRRVHETFLRNVWCGFIASSTHKMCLWHSEKKYSFFNSHIWPGLANKIHNPINI